MSTKEEIFDYVMNSPENTNPAVLKSLINSPDLKEVETIELTSEEAQRLLSQSGSTPTVGGRYVRDLMKEVRNGKPMPILKLPYDKPSYSYNVCDCRLVGKDPSPDAQYEVLMWTLVTGNNGIQSTGKGYFYSTIQNEPSINSTKVYCITHVYNNSHIRLQIK